MFVGLGVALALVIGVTAGEPNVGLGIGSVDPLTGVARGFTERMLNRRVSAGVLVDF